MEIYASLTHQGRFAAAVWADAPKVPLISFATQIIGEIVQMAAPPPGTPNPFSLADTKRLENSMVEIGFIDVQKERVNVTMELIYQKTALIRLKLIHSRLKSECYRLQFHWTIGQTPQ